MFPVFSVLFRVCSQLKPLKRRAVPTVPSCFASDYFLKCDWATSKSSERSGNTGNIRNNALYQSVAMFPLEDPSGNTGNNRRERRHRSHRRIWERSKPNLRAPALAPVKPYPQASALSLVQPSAALRRVASLPRWAIPLSWTLRLQGSGAPRVLAPGSANRAVRRSRLHERRNLVALHLQHRDLAPGNPPGMEERVRKALASVDPSLVLYTVDPLHQGVERGFPAGKYDRHADHAVRCA